MKILRFTSAKLNGYLNFGLAFDPSHSFLVGINGSGKTSALKAIVGLLSPDVDWLMNATYDAVTVSIDHDGTLIDIEAESVKSGRVITIRVNGDVLKQDLMSLDNYRSLVRHSRDYVYEEDGEIISLSDSHTGFPPGYETLDYLKNLPTPIYLGLDRSTLPTSNRRKRSRTSKSSRMPHATVRAFLDDSVGEAEEAAASSVRASLVKRQEHAIELRKKILLTLFNPSDDTRTSRLLPGSKDIKQYEQYRRSLKTAFNALGLDADDVSAAIDPFFSRLIGLANELKATNDVNEVFKAGNDKLWKAYREWIELAPRIQIFEQAESLVKRFNKHEAELFDKRDKYLSIMSSFLDDSNKSLSFQDDGLLSLRLPSGEDASVYYLSSGERQLFVLITTLMFVQDQKQANILIIDEPELSLHMKWQEMFVDSLIEANKDVQLILATHSPSIIVDRVEFCLDLA